MSLFALWPRFLEALAGAWLITSPVLFGTTGVVNEPLIGVLVIAFSLASLMRRTHWAHWFTGAAAIWLGAVPYFQLDRPGPLAAQNAIFTALLLLMLFILPTRHTEPPAEWRRF